MISILPAVFGVLSLLPTSGWAQAPDSIRVLFLGASYFTSGGGSQQPFEGFCKEAGLYCEAVSNQQTPPNPHDITFLDLETPIRGPGDASRSEKVHDLIRGGNYDFVVLWAYLGGIPNEWLPAGYGERFQSSSYEETLENLTSLHRTIVLSGAETVLYMWHPWLPFMHLTHPVAQLYMHLQDDLNSVTIDGRRHDVRLVPVGLLWLDAVAIPGHYDHEDSFALQPPRFSLADWYADPGHPGPLGQYANACLLFTYLTGLDPRGNPFAALPRDYYRDPPETPVQDVSAEDAEWIKNRAWYYYYSTSH